jgi:hypothetical protein
LLPGPYKLLGVVPPALAFIAALRVWAVAHAPARQSQGLTPDGAASWSFYEAVGVRLRPPQ